MFRLCPAISSGLNELPLSTTVSVGRALIKHGFVVSLESWFLPVCALFITCHCVKCKSSMNLALAMSHSTGVFFWVTHKRIWYGCTRSALFSQTAINRITCTHVHVRHLKRNCVQVKVYCVSYLIKTEVSSFPAWYGVKGFDNED